MHLTPGEKAVLAQIRVLYSIAGKRDQQPKALQMQWTPSHFDAYQKAFGGLLAKLLVTASNAATRSARSRQAGEPGKARRRSRRVLAPGERSARAKDLEAVVERGPLCLHAGGHGFGLRGLSRNALICPAISLNSSSLP
jgi:hypothetical protein